MRLTCVALCVGLLGVSCAQSESVVQAPSSPSSVAASGADALSSTLPADVVGVAWQWVSLTTPVEHLTVETPDRYTIEFDGAGRLSLRADCNRGFGSYALSTDRRLAVGAIALTRVACPPGSLSDRFAGDVGRASSYFVRDGELFLELPIDSGTLRFAQPR